MLGSFFPDQVCFVNVLQKFWKEIRNGRVNINKPFFFDLTHTSEFISRECQGDTHVFHLFAWCIQFYSDANVCFTNPHTESQTLKHMEKQLKYVHMQCLTD